MSPKLSPDFTQCRFLCVSAQFLNAYRCELREQSERKALVGRERAVHVQSLRSRRLVKPALKEVGLEVAQRACSYATLTLQASTRGLGTLTGCEVKMSGALQRSLQFSTGRRSSHTISGDGAEDAGTPRYGTDASLD